MGLRRSRSRSRQPGVSQERVAKAFLRRKRVDSAGAGAANRDSRWTPAKAMRKGGVGAATPPDRFLAAIDR